MARYLIIGDSFVRYLGNYQFRHHGRPLVVHGTKVDISSHSGSTIGIVGRRALSIGLRYSVVVLSIGTNNLCDAGRSAESVARDILNLVQNLVTLGIRQVVIFQVVRRRSTSHFRGRTLSSYNAAVDRLNSLLAVHCAGGQQIHMWWHQHRDVGHSNLAQDGVHLNEHGLHAYHDSVVRALSRHGAQ